MSNFLYHWGDLKMPNYAGSAPRDTCKSDGVLVIGLKDLLPNEPLTLKWDNEANQHFEMKIPIKELTSNYVVYGGNLSVKVNKTRVEVWLDEPDLARENQVGSFPLKPKKLIVTINLNEPVDK